MQTFFIVTFKLDNNRNFVTMLECFSVSFYFKILFENLYLQTEFQKEMLVKYAQKLACVNASHGTTAYDFQLILVLDIDD